MLLFRKKLNPLKLLQIFAKEYRKLRTTTLIETEKVLEIVKINSMLCELIKENDQFLKQILNSIETTYSSKEDSNYKITESEQ